MPIQISAGDSALPVVRHPPSINAAMAAPQLHDQTEHGVELFPRAIHDLQQGRWQLLRSVISTSTSQHLFNFCLHGDFAEGFSISICSGNLGLAAFRIHPARLLEHRCQHSLALILGRHANFLPLLQKLFLSNVIVIMSTTSTICSPLFVGVVDGSLCLAAAKGRQLDRALVPSLASLLEPGHIDTTKRWPQADTLQKDKPLPISNTRDKTIPQGCPRTWTISTISTYKLHSASRDDIHRKLSPVFIMIINEC